MILLDTSAIISFFISDQHTARAERIFQKVLLGKVDAAVTDLVLVETCGALRRRANKQSAELAYQKLQEWVGQGILSKLRHQEGIVPKACALAIKCAVKGADALIAATAQYYAVQLATFDDEVKEKLKRKVDFYEEEKQEEEEEG